MPVTVRSYAEADRDGVVAVILPIQRDEFGIAITLDDQPDLLAIPAFYGAGRGGFWVAEDADGRIVGTIALKDIGGGLGALRKMFVAATHRGAEHGVATALLGRLETEARERGFTELYLGTTDRFRAAHRFYEKHGFQAVARNALPPAFPVMAIDSLFYRKPL
jgi:GNAT superfamily N-acetyltransferase